jgi:hypothetical protein
MQNAATLIGKVGGTYSYPSGLKNRVSQSPGIESNQGPQ